MILNIILWVLLFVLILVIFASNFLVSYSLDTKSNFFVSKMLAKQGQNFIQDDFTENQKWLDDNCKILTLQIDNLSQKIYYTQKSSNKIAIILHGYGSDPTEAVRYAKHYFSLAYNCYLPCLRSQSLSQGRYISMGYKESSDVIKLINHIVQNAPNAQVLIHGVSMGAATTMMLNSKTLPSNVKLCIEDCGYTNVNAVFSDKLKKVFHLPSFPFIPIASGFSKMRAKFFFGQVNCVKAVQNAKLPMAFVHGKKDDFIPFFMLDKLYKVCPTDKIKLEVEEALHAKSVLQNPKLYWQTLDTFIQKYIK